MKPRGDSSALSFKVAESYEAMSRQAERLILEELQRDPALIFCASAGGTPTRLYELMAAAHERRPGLFKRMRVLQIDEWGGLPKGHPASCETDLQNKLLKPLAIRRDRYVGFRTETHHPQSEGRRVGQWLATNGPIGICILGLGINGHVAMNEPAGALIPHAHVARLARTSLKHPMLRNLKRKPRYGLTLGMADILSSRLILLLVNGKHKRAALERLLKPTVTTQFPASLLWLHPQAIVLCDREAAGAKPFHPS
jgi:galactosamine-6-phosphate isomerase